VVSVLETEPQRRPWRTAVANREKNGDRAIPRGRGKLGKTKRTQKDQGWPKKNDWGAAVDVHPMLNKPQDQGGGGGGVEVRGKSPSNRKERMDGTTPITPSITQKS